ncbi:hypothetical protein C8R42DRAFT_638608 [Lentinula raphanica]|nr:hypothetical protein C8R42DRAFT_638608 [Lentinula raphanica]
MDLFDVQTFYDYAHSLPNTYSSSDSSEGDVNDSSSDAGSNVSNGSSDYNSNSNNQPSDYSDSNNSGPPTDVSSDSEDFEFDSRPILGSDGRLRGQTTDSSDEENSDQSDDEGSDGDSDFTPLGISDAENQPLAPPEKSKKPWQTKTPKPKLSPLPWTDNDNKKIWELIGLLEKSENRVLLGTRKGQHMQSVTLSYRKHAKKLKITGNGVRDDEEEAENDNGDEEKQKQQKLKLYIIINLLCEAVLHFANVYGKPCHCVLFRRRKKIKEKKSLPHETYQTAHYPSLQAHEPTNWSRNTTPHPATTAPYVPDGLRHPGLGRDRVENDSFLRRRAPSVDSLPDSLDMSWYQGPLARNPPSDIESTPQTFAVITISDNDSGDGSAGESEVVIVPAKRTRGHRRGRPKKEVAACSDGVDELNELDSVATSKRPRGRPKKAKTDTVSITTAADSIDKDPDDSTFTFELLVHLMLPDKVIPGKTKRAKSKTEKQDPEPRGPVYVQSDKTWDEFLILVSSLVPTPVSGLFLSSFMWHFLSPANSPWLPVSTPEGFQSMLGQLKKKLLKGEAYVVIRMKKPVEVIAEPRTRSSTSVPEPALDDNESSDDDHPVSKMKAKELLELYGPGKCDLHPELPCFHFRPTNLHFELTRTRRLVWAQAILCGTVDKTQIPLTSKFIRKNVLSPQPLKAAFRPPRAFQGFGAPKACKDTPQILGTFSHLKVLEYSFGCFEVLSGSFRIFEGLWVSLRIFEDL